MQIWFCGDPHGQFGHITSAVQAHRPAAIVLLGDQMCERPLEVELADILGLTEVFWIHGNHDTDEERYYDNLCGSALGERGMRLRVIEIAGIRIAGLGGVFRQKIWDGYESPEAYLKSCGAGNRWRGGLPLRHRSSIFKSEIAALAAQRADVLVTHEAPDLHEYGHPALTSLAATMGARKAFHGHQHQMINYSGGVWHGLSEHGIVALNTATFETEIVEVGTGNTALG